MITIQQDSLHAALNAVTRASLKNSLMAAFSLVRLDVNTDGILRLSCFNGETAARATCHNSLRQPTSAWPLLSGCRSAAGRELCLCPSAVAFPVSSACAVPSL